MPTDKPYAAGQKKSISMYIRCTVSK